MANVTSVNRIISAKDYGGSGRAYIRNWQMEKMKHGISVLIRDLDKPGVGEPFHAIIWQGQWIVRTDCCNSASFVDPDEPIAVCFSCANRANNHRPRPVIFPPEAERLEIERLLLERPVDDVAGLTDMERAGLARPVLYVEIEEIEIGTGGPAGFMDMQQMQPRTVKRTYPLVRSWEGEPVEQLRAEQNTVIKAWHKKIRE